MSNNKRKNYNLTFKDYQTEFAKNGRSFNIKNLPVKLYFNSEKYGEKKEFTRFTVAMTFEDGSKRLTTSPVSVTARMFEGFKFKDADKMITYGALLKNDELNKIKVRYDMYLEDEANKAKSTGAELDKKTLKSFDVFLKEWINENKIKPLDEAIDKGEEVEISGKKIKLKENYITKDRNKAIAINNIKAYLEKQMDLYKTDKSWLQLEGSFNQNLEITTLANRWKQPHEEADFPRKVEDLELSPEQLKNYDEGQTVYLDDLYENEEGKKFPTAITKDKEGKLKFYFYDKNEDYDVEKDITYIKINSAEIDYEYEIGGVQSSTKKDVPIFARDGELLNIYQALSIKEETNEKSKTKTSNIKRDKGRFVKNNPVQDVDDSLVEEAILEANEDVSEEIKKDTSISR